MLRRGFGASMLCICGCLLAPAAPSIVHAESKATFNIVLPVRAADKEAYEPLVETLKAQLSDLPTDIRVIFVDDLPNMKTPDGQGTAASRLKEENADLVLIIDLHEGKSVYFTVLVGSGYRVLVRGLRGAGEEGVLDAVSLITRTTVETLMELGTTESPTPPSEEESPTPPFENSIPVDSPPPKNEPFLRVMAAVAYAPQWVAFTPDRAVSHAARMSVLLGLGERIRIGLGVSAAPPLTETSESLRITAFRLPFHLGVSLGAVVGNWRFGGGLTAVFSMLKVTPEAMAPEVTVNEPFYRFVFSSEALAEVGVRPATRLELFFAAGIETVFQKRTFKMENEPVLLTDAARVQPKMLLGLSVFLR